MNDPILTLIADDDPGMRLVMKKIVEKSEGFKLVGEASDGEELLELYRQYRPEIVIMDIEMPGATGVECARVIQDTNPKTVLIFATAHEQYMKDAFEVYAFDFLLKPFKLDRALKTLSLVREKLRPEEEPSGLLSPMQSEAPRSERLMVKGREGMSFVDLDKLLLIQREDRQTALYVEGDVRLLTSETLTELEVRLANNSFFRTHKSYIVNINRIDSITPYGRWTYNVRLRGTKHDALITHERFEELQKLFV